MDRLFSAPLKKCANEIRFDQTHITYKWRPFPYGVVHTHTQGSTALTLPGRLSKEPFCLYSRRREMCCAVLHSLYFVLPTLRPF